MQYTIQERFISTVVRISMEARKQYRKHYPTLKQHFDAWYRLHTARARVQLRCAKAAMEAGSQAAVSAYLDERDIILYNSLRRRIQSAEVVQLMKSEES